MIEKDTLIEDRTYLIQKQSYGTDSQISEIKILNVTDECIFAKWNRGNDIWKHKSEILDNYILVEDITDKIN